MTKPVTNLVAVEDDALVAEWLDQACELINKAQRKTRWTFHHATLTTCYEGLAIVAGLVREDHDKIVAQVERAPGTALDIWPSGV